MKTALDCYGRGKQKECNADEYIVGSVYSRDRFICPECGESVHLRRSKYSNYFAHYKRQNTSAECDRRVDGVPTDSIYEWIGLPIYLRHGAVKGTFELSLGFKALPRSLMEDAEKSKLQVSIDGESSYLVNRERFSEECTVLIPMADIIPYDRQCNLIKGIKENALVDAKFNIVFENSRIYAVNKDGNKREIYVYPAMWRKNNAMIPTGCIAISDKQLINSMPTAYSAIRVGVM